MSFCVTYHSDWESSAYGVHFRRPSKTDEAENREAKDVESGGVGGPNIRGPINLKIPNIKTTSYITTVAQRHGIAVPRTCYRSYVKGSILAGVYQIRHIHRWLLTRREQAHFAVSLNYCSIFCTI